VQTYSYLFVCFRLCLSISDFHPDTWNPAWSVSTILTGMLSFMVSRQCLTSFFNQFMYNIHRFTLNNSNVQVMEIAFILSPWSVVLDAKQVEILKYIMHFWLVLPYPRGVEIEIFFLLCNKSYNWVQLNNDWIHSLIKHTFNVHVVLFF